MTTWSDLKTYILSNYQSQDISEPGSELVKILTDLDGGRSQISFVGYDEINGHGLVLIRSVFGTTKQIKPKRALRAAENNLLVPMGIGTMEDFLVVTHVAPIADMNADEFDMPLAMVYGAADDLEKNLVGGDDY